MNYRGKLDTYHSIANGSFFCFSMVYWIQQKN